MHSVPPAFHSSRSASRTSLHSSSITFPIRRYCTTRDASWIYQFPGPPPLPSLDRAGLATSQSLARQPFAITQHTLASSSTISHSSSCSPLGRMPSNPGHLLTSNLFIWSNTSWIFPCIYIDGCCILASSSYQGFQSKRLGANNSDTTQMKAASLIQGCCRCVFPSRRASFI